MPTLQGRISLKIPAGVQPGNVLRVKGEGVARLRGRGRGDMLITVRVVTPRSLDPEERRLFEELSKRLESVEGANEGKGWFDRIRETLGSGPS